MKDQTGEDSLSNRPSKPRVLFISLLLGAALGALALPFSTASCSTQPQTKPGEAAALERLRASTRNGALPPEQTLAQLEADYASTRAGALARPTHARLKLAANEKKIHFATVMISGAPALLSSFKLSFHRCCRCADVGDDRAQLF